MKHLFLFLLFVHSVAFAAEEVGTTKETFSYSFQGPKNWVKIDQELPPKVMLAFIGKGKKDLPPSINLAIEKTDLNLTAYVKKAKQSHEKQPETTCTDLGTINTKSGKARLLQIVSSTHWGPVQFLQAIMLKNEVVYVITATAVKEEFGQNSTQFFQCIKNFSS